MLKNRGVYFWTVSYLHACQKHSDFPNKQVIQVIGAAVECVHSYSIVSQLPQHHSKLVLFGRRGFGERQLAHSQRSHRSFFTRMQQTASTKPESPSEPRLRFPSGDTRTTQQLADEFQNLVQEGVRIALQTSPRVGVARTLQAVRAIVLTGAELAQKFQGRGSVPTLEALQEDAPVILRQLFERLGSTVCHVHNAP